MAIRITKVYTRTGDRGETALVGGRRVPKDSPRIIAYGAIDELNSILGVVRALAAKESSPPAVRLIEILQRLQNELFDLGSELATPPDAEYEGMSHASETEVRALDDVSLDIQPHEFLTLQILTTREVIETENPVIPFPRHPQFATIVTVQNDAEYHATPARMERARIMVGNSIPLELSHNGITECEVGML